MKKNFILYLFISMLISLPQLKAQTTDSTAMAKSQQRIEKDLGDANKHQKKIDKRQKKIERQQKKINRQERKRERKMKDIKKEQKKMND